jgi:hypothetical protein
MAMFELQGTGPALNWIVVPLLFIIPMLLIAVLFVLGGLPGKIAASRGHRRATAVMLCGWFGLFTIVLWPLALIWAYMDPPDAETRPDLLSHDDIDQLAVCLRRTSDRVSNIERLISENAPNL